jgi:hypothetical protein
MSTSDEYELIEVQVSKKIEVKLTIDDLLDALQQQVNAISSGATQQPPQVVDRLRQLGQLAHDLKGQLGGGSA